MLTYKTYAGKGFSIMTYCGPMILALLLRLIKFRKEPSPCSSLLQLFKTMGVIFRLSLVITLSVKFEDMMDWTWQSAFWYGSIKCRPLWCSFAIQGVMILFTLVLLLWSLIMLCRRVYPLTFCNLLSHQSGGSDLGICDYLWILIQRIVVYSTMCASALIIGYLSQKRP